MWKIWLFFSVFKFSFSAPVDSEDPVATGNLDGLRCLLLASPFASCDDIKRYGNNIPRRLQQLYSKVKKPFAEVKNAELMDTNSLDNMPTSLLYLTPRIRLQNMTGHTAGSILKRSPDDEALAIKLTSILNTDADRQAFLEMLPLEMEGNGGARLSAGVERELGRALAQWYPTSADWQFWQFDIALTAGSPVLAYLPSNFLNRMPHSVAEKFLFHLRNWQPDYPDTPRVWSQHSNYVKRIWTSTALKKLDRPQLWFPGVIRFAAYLLLGATPDEIPLITSYIRDPLLAVPLLTVDFDPLQTRRLFDVAVENFTDYTQIKYVKNLVKHFLPRQIQRFDINQILPDDAAVTLPTQSQLLQHKIARLIAEQVFADFAIENWKGNVSYLGTSLALFPASSLEILSNTLLNFTTLAQITSDSLTFRQTRYLTNNNSLIRFDQPETILNANYHLKALPASLLNDQFSNQIPDVVKRHLLRYIPAKSRALTAMLLEKTLLDIDDRPFLKALLQNENHDDILRLLSNRDIEARFQNFTDSFYAIAQEDEQLARKIRNLPHNIGATLLAVFRREIAENHPDGWTVENLVENPKHPLLRLLISNLQCDDVDLINDVDVVPILGHYVRERKALGLLFPKNMQYCCQKALTRYLKLKSSLRYLSTDSSGLLNFLEAFEVRAVGGYILSSLPMNVIKNTVLKHHIITEIGSLRLSELMVATSLANLRALTVKHQNELYLREMLDLGNLVWFLSRENAKKLNAVHFKLFLEMREPHDRMAPCLNAQEREFWREFLMLSVGKPSAWTAGTLALLGDLLYVFDETDLEVVSAVARAEAADVLARNVRFHERVEWPGKLEEISYYEACVETLGEAERPAFKKAVRTLIRFYLESAQIVMTTVISAKELNQIDDDDDLAVEVESAENSLDGRVVKRSVGGFPPKRGRIFKRVLNHDQFSSGELKKSEFIANGSRALVVVETDGNVVHISETFPRKSMRIGCDAIRMVGPAVAFVLDEEDVKEMTDIELEDCAELLGSFDLPVNVRKAIWPRLSKWRESNNLLEVGNLVSVIDDDAILALSLDISHPWSLESLAILADHVSNEESLSLIADRFILGNPSIKSSLRFGTAAALGPIICKIIHSRQQKLLDNPNVFLQLASLIGAARNIDGYCIGQMMEHARIAYGPPHGWSAADVSELGVIIAGLKASDTHNLQPDALSGVSPAAVAQIPPEVFKGLSELQLARLPALSIAAISPAQTMSLSPAQSEILERVRRQIPDKDLGTVPTSNSSSKISTGFLTFVVTALAVGLAGF